MKELNKGLQVDKLAKDVDGGWTCIVRKGGITKTGNIGLERN